MDAGGDGCTHPNPNPCVSCDPLRLPKSLNQPFGVGQRDFTVIEDRTHGDLVRTSVPKTPWALSAERAAATVALRKAKEAAVQAEAEWACEVRMEDYTEFAELAIEAEGVMQEIDELLVECIPSTQSLAPGQKAKDALGEVVDFTSALRRIGKAILELNRGGRVHAVGVAVVRDTRV